MSHCPFGTSRRNIAQEKVFKEEKKTPMTDKQPRRCKCYAEAVFLPSTHGSAAPPRE